MLRPFTTVHALLNRLLCREFQELLHDDSATVTTNMEKANRIGKESVTYRWQSL